MTASVPALAPASQPAAAGSDAKQHAMLLALAAALIALRLPDAVLDGRFWAEEGAVYFRNALHDGWAAALFTVHTGYLNLAASTATLLAAHVPLPCAPYVTETVALLLQLCPAALLLTADLPWLRRPVTGLIAVALIVLAPNAAEVWLNSITSQFHLALAAALVLALPVRRGVAGATVLLLLAFAGLSGPAAAALAPLSALRAALDRSPGRAWQAAVLLLCAAVQAAVWLAYPEPARSLGIDPQTLLLAAAVKHLALPLLGLDAARATGVWLASHPLSLPAGAACAATLAAAAALAAGVVRAGRAELAWMFAAGLALACFSYAAALGNHADLLTADFGGRYAFAPGVLFALTLLGVAAGTRGAVRAAAGVPLAALVVVCVASFPDTPALFTTGPAWADEAARWQADPRGYRPQLWPDLPTWRRDLGTPP